MDVDIQSSLLTLDKTSKLFVCSLNRNLGRHPLHLRYNGADVHQLS